MAAVGFRYWRGSNVVMDSYLIMSPDASTSFDLCLDINSVEQLPTDNLLRYTFTPPLYRKIPSTEKEKREKKRKRRGEKKGKKFSKVVGAKDLFTVPRKKKEKRNKKRIREKKKKKRE